MLDILIVGELNVDVFMGGLAFAISKWTTGIYFDILHCLGNFVIAWVLFMIIKALNKAKAAVEKEKEEAPADPTTKKCPFCCSEIDIEAVKCPNCTSDITEAEEVQE